MTARHDLQSIKAVAALLAGALITSQVAASDYVDCSTILQESGLQQGIIVQLGCGSGRRSLELHADGQFVVQALDRDQEKVASAQQWIQTQGRDGGVSVRRLAGAGLPYVDNLVNLLVADEPLDISEPEIIRVLRPLGMAWVREGDSWKKIVKPWPGEIDEWTHFLHSATGNAVSKDTKVGPPRRLQWSAGSMWGRSHEFNNSFPALVTSRGRMFYVFDQGITGMEDERLPERWTLFARDAFNGTLLWERPLTSWGTHQWRTRALRFLGGNIARRLVADQDRLYCTFEYGGNVRVLDAATGKTLTTIPRTEGTEEILVADDQVICASRTKTDGGKLVARITCYDAPGQQVKWQVEAKTLLSQVLSVGKDAVVYHNRESVICLNRSDGGLRWKAADQQSVGGRRGNSKMLLLATDKVVVSSRQKIVALSLADGRTVWQAPGAQGSSMREYDLFYSQGHVWATSSGAKIAGYDINTGKPAKELDASRVQSPGHHLRCYRAKATDRFLITQFRGVEFLSLDQEAHHQNDWLRGSCAYGIMPANGFLYAPPHSCFCFAAAMSKGFKAFASDTNEVLKQQYDRLEPAPLEQGPHYGFVTAAPAPSKNSWPTYRHDARRTGATPGALPSSLRRRWKASLGTQLTPPVAAAGCVFVAAKNKHTIHALDAQSGNELWTFASGARIDSPPSYHRGLLVFGSADGFLYCLRADNGRLAWRRRLAPAERWMAVDGQLESVWRVHGSVAIEGELAYCSAGRSSYLDGGLFLYAVDIQTGDVRHHARLDTLADTRVDKTGKPFVPSYHIEGANSDVLVAEGGYIYLNQMKFSPDLKLQPSRYLSREEITARPSLNLDGKEFVNQDIFAVKWKNKTYATYDELAEILVDEKQNLGERDTGLHLYTTSGFLDSSFFNRTYWMYSKTWPGFNITNLAPKSGQMLVVGDKNTYALKAYTSRFALSPKMNPQARGYLLIADDNHNEPTMDPRAWGKDKGMGFSRGAPPVWHAWIPVRVQAMALADETLIVCGPPDILRRDDATAAFEGRMGSQLQLVSAVDGKTISQQKLSESPVFDGMIVADHQLVLCTQQGDVICMGSE